MCAEQQTEFDPKSCNFPVYATQGGGYATFENGRYVWLAEIPSFINATIGDLVPEDWSITAVNDLARHEAEPKYDFDGELLDY